MMNQVVISIVIPCYNHGKYLLETIDSIYQTKDNYPIEIIIVNDGSTDLNTKHILEEIEKTGIYVLHQENQGLGRARNNGIAIAKGKYILPLDSDNKVCKPYLSTAVELLEHNNVDVVYGDAKYFGEKSGRWKNKPFNLSEMLAGNKIDACAVFSKSVWEEVGGYATDMPFMGCEDWNFWLKCASANKRFYYLDEICFEYRVLSDSMIRTVPEDFEKVIFAYNCKEFMKLYKDTLVRNEQKINAVFHGSLLRKMSKMVLNHFNLLKY